MRRIVLLWVIMVVVLNPQGCARQRAPRKHCPPHSPAITISVPEGGYQTDCLVCGKRGPRRKTSPLSVLKNLLKLNLERSGEETAYLEARL